MKKVIIAIAAIVSLASCSEVSDKCVVIERYNMQGGFVSRDTVELSAYTPRQVGDTVFLRSQNMMANAVIAVVRVR